MRTVVAIILILCGTLLILAPAVMDTMDRLVVAAILAERNDMNNVSLNAQPMTTGYRMVCWMLGGGMILVGTAGGPWGHPAPPPPPPPPRDARDR